MITITEGLINRTDTFEIIVGSFLGLSEMLSTCREIAAEGLMNPTT